MTVHPHACGEHYLGLDLARKLDGSSPRMWGTQINFLRGFKPARFIPTHVGNTSKWLILSTGYTVHPHACGEHIVQLSLASAFYGSSPRMWGTLYYCVQLTYYLRFIPTHVGNTPKISICFTTLFLMLKILPNF